MRSRKRSWKCRHAYFRKWAAFQTKASLAKRHLRWKSVRGQWDQRSGQLYGLEWEKKTNLDGSVNFAGSARWGQQLHLEHRLLRTKETAPSSPRS